MTATHIESLIAAADLSDRLDRLMLADALEEAGREEEAAALRDQFSVAVAQGRVFRLARQHQGWRPTIIASVEKLGGQFRGGRFELKHNGCILAARDFDGRNRAACELAERMDCRHVKAVRLSDDDARLLCRLLLIDSLVDDSPAE